MIVLNQVYEHRPKLWTGCIHAINHLLTAEWLSSPPDKRSYRPLVDDLLDASFTGQVFDLQVVFLVVPERYACNFLNNTLS